MKYVWSPNYKHLIYYLLYTLVKNFIFNFRIYKIFSYPLRFADFSSNEFTSTFAAFSHTKHFHCFILQEVA